MKRRVWDYCLAHDYRSEAVRRTMSRNRAYTFNLLVVLPFDPELHEKPFFLNCLLGIYEEAAEHDYNIMITAAKSGDLTALKNVVEERKADGVIFMFSLIRDVMVEYLTRQGVSFLVIGAAEKIPALYVDNNSVVACRELTSYLLGKNIHRIALIGGSMKYAVSEKRLEGFRKGFSLHHQIPDEKLIHLNCTSKTKIYDAVEKIAKDCAECILCMDDRICSHVLVKLRTMNISIPRDIKVASFYDSTLLQEHYPPVTALQFDERKLGKLACKKIINKLEKGTESPEVYVEYKMALRASTK